MFRFMIQKLRHKKWLALCLLIGNILLVAVAAGYPMYKDASLQRMLADEFNGFEEKSGRHPGLITMSSTARKGEFQEDFLALEEYSTRVSRELGVEQDEYVAYISLAYAKGESLSERISETKRNINIGMLSGLSDHSKVIDGKMCSNQLTSDGYLEVVITEAALIEQKFVIGEEMIFEAVKGTDGTPLRVRIVGVIKNSEENDPYWVAAPDSYDDCVFASEELFSKMFLGNRMGAYNLNATWYVVSDCMSLRQKDAGEAKERVERLLGLQSVMQYVWLNR